jgi:hypothetical protein
MSGGLSKVVDHLRADLGRNDKPQFEARFETHAKLLGGFVTVFRYCRARRVPHGDQDTLEYAAIGLREPAS